MRKRMATAAALVLLAVAFGGVARTATAGSSSAAATEIVVVIPPGTFVSTFLDFDHHGFTLGDRVVLRGELWDPAQSHRMGKTKGECVVVSDKLTTTKGLFRCSYLLQLGGGDLVVEGLDPHGPGSSTFAILGGTGRYSSASGDADVVDTASRTEFYLHVVT
jgi:hypothetical protein